MILIRLGLFSGPLPSVNSCNAKEERQMAFEDSSCLNMYHISHLPQPLAGMSNAGLHSWAAKCLTCCVGGRLCQLTSLPQWHHQYQEPAAELNLHHFLTSRTKRVISSASCRWPQKLKDACWSAVSVACMCQHASGHGKGTPMGLRCWEKAEKGLTDSRREWMPRPESCSSVLLGEPGRVLAKAASVISAGT